MYVKKLPNAHHNVAVKTTRLCVQRIGEKIAILQCRRHVDIIVLPVANTLPKEVLTDITVFAIGSGRRVFRQMNRPLVICLHRVTPNIDVPKNKTPEVPHENRLAKPVAITKYSAFVDESVMDFCIVE